MPPTQAQRRARNKWLAEKVDQINFRVPKGKKALLQAHAAEQGEALNVFLNRAVDEAIARDREKREGKAAD